MSFCLQSWLVNPTGRGRWGGQTHTSKQCAADSSHLSATRTAPQRCSRRRSHRLTCQGHSPRPAALPPTILVIAATGARPQSAGKSGTAQRLSGQTHSHPGGRVGQD